MDHRVTQCPRCGTSFRVTEAHLAVAAGAVRCGSCLHIFNAREHWADSAQEAASEKNEKPITAKKIEEIEIDDDALFDDDTPIFDDDEQPPQKTSSGAIFNPVDDDFEVIDDSGPEQFSETFLEINSWEEDSSHSFNREREYENDSVDSTANEQQWTRKLLEEDDEKTSTALKAPARSDIFGDFDSILDDVPEVDENDEAEAAPSVDSSEFSAEFLNLDAESSATRSTHPSTAAETVEELQLESMSADTATTPTGERALFGLSGLEHEPLQLHQFVHEPRWPKVLWWTALIAMLALGIGQYIYFNFDELSRGPMRPWLAQACNRLGCVLPAQFDVAQIRTNSLIVRSHPTHRGALAVDVILTNQADFPQPYPPLQLQFSDLNGAPVAGRRFQPQEYLKGELSGSHLMPVRQPVHIALELVDPGSRAVNYQLSVVNPEPAP